MNKLRAALAASILFTLAAVSPVFALEEGHHAHLGVDNLPITTIPRADYTFDLVVQAHGQAGMTGAQVRVSDYGEVMPSTVNGRTIDGYHSLPVSSILAGPYSVKMTVPFGSWTCGRHEVRFTVRFKPNFDGKEQFTTSRAYIWLAGCNTLRNRTNVDWYGGGGGWYTGVDYALGLQQSPFSSFRAGATTKWRVQSNANRGCLFLNPAAHAGSMGTPIGPCWTGTGQVSRTLPSSLVPGDRIMEYAEDTTPSKQHAGTYVVWVPEPGATTVKVDVQDWWNTGGLVVP